MSELREGCPEWIVRQYGGSGYCGRPIDRNGLCKRHATAKETAQRRREESAAQAARDRQRRQELTLLLAAGNNLASLLRAAAPDVSFLAQESARDVVIEMDLRSALELLKRLDPTKRGVHL